jgi:acetone carboxylase, gamma subunit
MKVPVTEYLEIDVDGERWCCRRCAHDVGPAREPYKQGLLVHARHPAEIHKPILDPQRYVFTFAPDGAWISIVEFYCPGCGVMMEVEYLPIGHPPQNDMEFDIDAFKAQWRDRKPLTEAELAGPDAVGSHGHEHKSKHQHGGRAP